jgi:hypothetical protein
MNLFYRGLAAGACALGLVVLAADPGDLSAQPKKDIKVDPKKTDPKKDEKKGPIVEEKGKTDVVGSFATQDGLGIRRYWFTAGKGSADTVLMFPAPGKKVTDSWINLGKALQKEGFSVMLFDWRGCGMSGPERGERILVKQDTFENDLMYKHAPKSITTKGLDWNQMSGRFKDTILYDLMGARFALDKQNDAAQCNTNRIWLISEGAGAQLAMAWIAVESQRNTSYVRANRFDDQPPTYTPASLDYVGVVSLSYSPTSPLASDVYRNGVPNSGKYTKETNEHFDRRVAMVMVHGKKEGPSASKSMLGKYVNTGNEDEMRKRFKYLKEIDTSTTNLQGIGLIPDKDPFGTQAYIVKAMTEIRDKNDAGKERRQRDADKYGDVPMFEIGKFRR